MPRSTFRVRARQHLHATCFVVEALDGDPSVNVRGPQITKSAVGLPRTNVLVIAPRVSESGLLPVHLIDDLLDVRSDYSRGYSANMRGSVRYRSSTSSVYDGH